MQGHSIQTALSVQVFILPTIVKMLSLNTNTRRCPDTEDAGKRANKHGQKNTHVKGWGLGGWVRGAMVKEGVVVMGGWE